MCPQTHPTPARPLFAYTSDPPPLACRSKAGPLLARYTAGGLTSASPAGLPKAGPCDTLGSWT